MESKGTVSSNSTNRFSSSASSPRVCRSSAHAIKRKGRLACMSVSLAHCSQKRPEWCLGEPPVFFPCQIYNNASFSGADKRGRRRNVMKAVQANNCRQANDPTHKDEVDPAHKIIMEIDALWRMSYGYGTSLHSISMRDEEDIMVASSNSRKAC